MTEDDARRVLLTRAWELGPPTPAWSLEDRAQASDDAMRAVAAAPVAPGVPADSTATAALVVARAREAAGRLVRRSPTARRAMAAAVWRPWFTPLAVGLSMLAGFLLDAVSAEQYINLLAPPVLLTLLWNLCVYGWLLVDAVRARSARSAAGAEQRHGAGLPAGALDAAVAPLRGLSGWIARWTMRLRPADDGEARAEQAPFLEFAHSWTRFSTPLTRARVLRMLHAGAAAFAFGAIAGLYLRGLAFEYRAGWQSTFLSAEAVERIVRWVLTPASGITGIALPDSQHLAALRAPHSLGENAAPWIHLHAVTTLIVVMIPRLLLALREHRTVRRLQDAFPLPLTDAYFGNLWRRATRQQPQVSVAPYNMEAAGVVGTLQSLLDPVLGGPVQLTLLPRTDLGDDGLPAGLQQAGADLLLALYAANATPERETHGEFARALRAARPEAPVVGLVDESAFRRRFEGQPERLQARRDAWRGLMRACGMPAPVFFSTQGQAEAAPPTRELRQSIDAAASDTRAGIRS